MIGSRLINARAETVASKPAFRHAFKRRRCLLPADGYYEWQRPDGGSEDEPGGRGGVQAAVLHHPRRRRPAGLRRPVRAVAGSPALPDDHERAWLWTATIITTSAPDELGRIHDRMPMVIEPGRWATGSIPADSDPADLRALLAPAATGGLISYPVSTAVNSVRNNGPELMERIELSPARPGPEARCVPDALAPADPGARHPKEPLAAPPTSCSEPELDRPGSKDPIGAAGPYADRRVGIGWIPPPLASAWKRSAPSSTGPSRVLKGEQEQDERVAGLPAGPGGRRGQPLRVRAHRGDPRRRPRLQRSQVLDALHRIELGTYGTCVGLRRRGSRRPARGQAGGGPLRDMPGQMGPAATLSASRGTAPELSHVGACCNACAHRKQPAA